MIVKTKLPHLPVIIDLVTDLPNIAMDGLVVQQVEYRTCIERGGYTAGCGVAAR